jgi:tetratricopeptide (TPR) repeat protein/predicted negative regulator of RcsB-dependent stress response
VTNSAAPHLRDALADRYLLERELGRGGMATVYLARDLKHDRSVALKVLHPELAATLGPERFLREIHLTARLDHPHILPVFDSGEAAGFLWYTMPYVGGESLRERLRHESQLPVEEAVRIAREVAEALDYAHRAGVLHRDVKPENILLSERHARVADFGVARALEAAGTPQLTATGLVVGTPAYMSPEQASAGQVDARSDVYALGCVLYEMLAGEPPYTGATPQAVAAKRLTDPIPSIRRLRKEIPETVDRAIRIALAKTPADRFATAAQFGSALAVPSARERDGSSPGAPGTERHRARRLAVVVLGVAALIALGLVLFGRSRPVLLAADERTVMILPFRVAGADPGLGYLREGMVDLLAAKLTGDGGPRSVDPRTVISAWRREGGSAHDDLPEERALAVARRLGAGRLIEGSVVGPPERVVLTASLVKVSGGRTPLSVSVEGPLDSLSALVDRLTARLLAGEAGEAENLANLTTTSLPALEAYLEGRAAYRSGRYIEAVQQFGRALEIDSTFALAGLGLRAAALWTSAPEEATRGLALAWAARDRLGKRDRLFLVAAAGPRYPAPTPWIEDLAAWERVVEASPDQPEAQYELADLLFHDGPAFDADDSWNRAARGFARAFALDSTFTSPLSHLIELAAITHDTASLRGLSALYLSRNPRADDADYVRWRLVTGVGDTAEQTAVRARFGQLPIHQLMIIAQIGQYDGIALQDVERAMELIPGRAQTRGEREGTLFMLRLYALNRGRPDAASRATAALESYDSPSMPHGSLYLRVLDALYWNGDTASAAVAVSKLAGSAGAPPARRAPARTSQLLDICVTELWRLARGDTRTSERAIVQLREGAGVAAQAYSQLREGASARDVAFLPDLAYSVQLCAGLLDAMRSALDTSGMADQTLERLDSLARARSDEAQRELVHAANLEIARLQESRGNLTGALQALRRRAYFSWDLDYFSTTLREEGRIAVLTGDRAGAVRAYQHYLALRSDPEPSQKPEVEQVRSELATLLAEPRP